MTAVIVDDSTGMPAFVMFFEITSMSDDMPTLLDTLYESARTRVAGLLPIDRAVIRRADKAPVPSGADGPRDRLLAEGALAAAVRSVVPDTRMCTGLELGRWDGSNKETIDQTGTDLITTSGLAGTAALKKRLSTAAAAARTALRP